MPLGGGLWASSQRWITARTGVSRPFHVEVSALGLIVDFGAESAGWVDSLLHLDDTDLQLPHLQSEGGMKYRWQAHH